MEDKLETLKQQVQADFELTWTMMNDQGKRLDARVDGVKASVDTVKASVEALKISVDGLSITVDKMGGEIQEGNRQLIGRMRLLEERFRTIIEAVQQEIRDKVSRQELQDLASGLEARLAARLEALERRLPAA